MSKQVLFSRHAEAELGYPELHDHDRKLTNNGIQASKNIFKSLVAQNINPDIYISSSAVRALETCKIIKGKENKERIEISRDIYTDSLSGIEVAIRGVSDSHNMIAIFGHNPTLSQIYNSISTSKDIDFPTSGIFIAEMSAPSWLDFNFSDMKLKVFINPNNIK